MRIRTNTNTTNHLSKLFKDNIYNDDVPRNYIGASSIGNSCLRAIWYDWTNAEKVPFTLKQLRTFSMGRILEAMVIGELQESGLEIIVPESGNNYLEVKSSTLPDFKGHLDGIIIEHKEKSVLEIKTAKDSSYKTFVNNGLFDWQPSYYAQIQAYMGMAELSSAYMLVLNKDSSETWDEKINFDQYYYEGLVAKAQGIRTSTEAPPRINKSPLYYICQMCKFRKVCHG